MGLATQIIIPNPPEKIKPFFQKIQIFLKKPAPMPRNRGENPRRNGGRAPEIVVYYIG